MKLIITEKAIAGQRISEILSDGTAKASREGNAQVISFERGEEDFLLIPLRGHIVDVDFPKQYSYWLGTDLKKLVAAPIEYIGKEKDIIEALSKKREEVDEVIIATDADREGESIGREALTFIEKNNKKTIVSRAYFSAITPSDIEEAFEKPKKLDYNYADSADCRREIDLVWGAVLTRYLSLVSGQLGKDFLSAGRVQTPVLAIIVQREKERMAFEMKKYWVLEAIFEKNKEKFFAEHKTGKFFDKKEAQKAFGKKAALGTVKKVESKKRVLAKPIPFNTTEFLRAATAIGMTAGEAMNIAEQLYQQGFISYPRTDNTVFKKTIDLKTILLKLRDVKELSHLVDKIIALGKIEPSAGKKETTDHPPIYPVMPVQKEKLSEKQWKVYELVTRRFLAVLSTDAETLNMTVDIDLNTEPFVAWGQTITKPGWKEFYPYSKLTETILPKLKKGDTVNLVKLDMAEKETQPPARYSQSTLIKLMEQLGLGTKCLDGNTKIKAFNSPTPKLVSLKEVFENSHQTILKDESAEIRENKKLECIGVSIDGKIKRTNFLFASKRPTVPQKDKMKSIIFSDKSSITATIEHPILCFDGEKNLFKPVYEISQGTRAVALHDNSTVGSLGQISWNDFAKKCSKKTCLFAYDLAKELKTARINAKKSQQEFANFLNCSQGNYSNYEADKRPVPLWIAKKSNLSPKKISSQNEKSFTRIPFPIEINAHLARILAKLIGDGSLDREKVKRENCFDFRYTNTNPHLIEEFRQDIKKIFKISTKIYGKKNKKAVKVPAVAGRIIATLFSDILSKRPWKQLPTELYADFIGAFFDDEGHASKKETKLFLSNTNHGTLKDLQKMLKTLGIESKMDSRQHKLHVRQRQSLFNFLEQIPITSINKKQRLINMLSIHYRHGPKNKPLFLFEKEILTQLSAPKTTAQLQKIFKISNSAIVNRIRKLKLEGKIKKLVTGNNKDIPRMIKYCNTIDLPNSAYALLGEKVIAPKLATKTVQKIQNTEPKKFVYDITNSPQYPAFVLENNVIVHNSTRHEIIQKLYSRRYIAGLKSVEPNKISFAVIDSLQKYAKTVTESEMTSALEKEMDEIAAGKKSKKEIVDKSTNYLTTILDHLLEHKNNIGQDLRNALQEDSIVGVCDKCGKGALRKLKSKNQKWFLACNRYPECKTTYPLPQNGKVYATEKKCATCGKPVIRVVGTRFRYEMCIDHMCLSKKDWKKKDAKEPAEKKEQVESKETETKQSQKNPKKPEK